MQTQHAVGFDCCARALSPRSQVANELSVSLVHTKSKITQRLPNCELLGVESGERPGWTPIELPSFSLLSGGVKLGEGGNRTSEKRLSIKDAI